MAKIVKLVDRLIPSTDRSQVFTDADASTDDILDFEASLGRPAREVRITTAGGSDLTIKRNVLNTIFPRRTNDQFSTQEAGHNINTALGQEVEDTTVSAEVADAAMTLQGPVKNLKVTWSAGTWEVVVS